jgi:hypothetical protein
VEITRNLLNLKRSHSSDYAGYDVSAGRDEESLGVKCDANGDMRGPLVCSMLIGGPRTLKV